MIRRPRRRAEKSRGQAYTHHTTAHPMHPGRGSDKEATSGVFAGSAWPDFASPAVASLGSIPVRPPVAARAAGEAAGLDGSENRMDLNVPVPDSVATSRLRLRLKEGPP